MVDDTMIVVNLDLLAITLAVLVCALAIALRVLWEYRCKHKATLYRLHEALDERDLLERFYDAVQQAPVGTGVCCCGDSMDKHSDPYHSNHSPVDEWDNFLSKWKDRLGK